MENLATETSVSLSRQSVNDQETPNSFEEKKNREIQQIIESNEEMVHEQIKMIKKLHEENEQIRSQYKLLQQKYHMLLEFAPEKNETQNTDKQQQNLSATDSPTRLSYQQLIDKLFELKTTIQSNTTPQAVVMSSTSRHNINTVVGSPIKRSAKKITSEFQKENLENYIPIAMIRKDNQYFQRKRKNSLQEESNVSPWNKELQKCQNLTESRANKFKEKTLPLAKKGIPHELRHKVWPLIFENGLGLTNELYADLLERKEGGWLPQDVRIQIDKDISRSFSGRTRYEKKTGLNIEVCEVLQLFHVYRPDVSYIQGMTYPVIVLTLVVGKMKAFQLFSNLILGNIFFRRLFTFQDKFVPIVTCCFDLLLKQYSHDISNKLEARKIRSELFLIEWLFTIFSRGLSFDLTLKLWDQIAYQGQLIIFKVALSIFEIIGSRLATTNYEETIGLIQDFGGFISERKLFQCVIHHKLSSDKLARTMEKAEKIVFKQTYE